MSWIDLKGSVRDLSADAKRLDQEDRHFLLLNKVEQCTGIKDKSGTLIYEGDILKSVVDDEMFVVSWENETASFSLESEGDITHFDCFYGSDFYVIGNIHENKDII